MIKVFIIDDSRLVRKSVRNLLKPFSDIRIIGEAPNPVDAFVIFRQVGLPDVFILDIEMPKMDGISFLRQIRDQKPIPTIIFSAVAAKGSDNAINALMLGACDVLQKPATTAYDTVDGFADDFIDKIRACARSKCIRMQSPDTPHYTPPLPPTDKVVAIGASTGGVQALSMILPRLEPNHAPLLITQHMPPGFTASFAARLDGLCPNSHIKEASDGDTLLHGQVLIAPGGFHLEVARAGQNRYKARLKNFPKVSGHKPSVDVLFSSLAKAAKDRGVAVLLTGMGKDGALGTRKVKEAGGETFGQNEASCVVYGMPKAAFEMGGIRHQIQLSAVAGIINRLK